VRVKSMAVVGGVASVPVWSLQVCVAPAATAEACPNIDVVLARRTGEPPGLGPTGQAFVHALRPQIARKSLTVHPVDHPPPTNGPRLLTA
jgi:cutinase-like protein